MIADGDAHVRRHRFRHDELRGRDRRRARRRPARAARGRAATGARSCTSSRAAALTAGAPAIARYLETEGEGRLVQSIKSHLASASFTTTQILGRRWALEDMIAAYLRQVRAAAPVDLGIALRGRPAGALLGRRGRRRRCARGRAACATRSARPGFDEVVFEYEPVGAAARYAARLDHDELIVVADFGGGTTDFSVIRVGPRRRAGARDRRHRRLGRCVRRARDRCGGRARARPRLDAIATTRWAARRRCRRGCTATCGAGTTCRSSRRSRRSGCSSASRAVRSSRRRSSGSSRVVEDDLGLPLHRAVEGAKVRLSQAPTAIASRSPAIDARSAGHARRLRHVDRRGPRRDRRACSTTCSRARASTAATIDRVFATGGSSLVPAVRGAARGAVRRGQARRWRGADERRVGPRGARAPALGLIAAPGIARLSPSRHGVVSRIVVR